MLPSPYDRGLSLRGLAFSGPPLRSLSLRPGDSLTIPWMALSMGFKYSVSLLPAIQATGALALTLARLTLAEHASLSWTHNHIRTFLSPANNSRIWQETSYSYISFFNRCVKVDY